MDHHLDGHGTANALPLRATNDLLLLLALCGKFVVAAAVTAHY